MAVYYRPLLGETRAVLTKNGGIQNVPGNGTFHLLPDTFLGTTFCVRIWPVLISGICSKMT